MGDDVLAHEKYDAAVSEVIFFVDPVEMDIFEVFPCTCTASAVAGR